MAITDIPAQATDLAVTASDDNANSATFPRCKGIFNLEGALNNGRAVNEYQRKGALSGLRLGDRTFPTIAFEEELASPWPAWSDLVHGQVAGYTSTVADLGDVRAVDITVQFPYSSDTRTIVFQDCVLEGESLSLDGSTRSWSFSVKGPTTVTTTAGSYTLVSSR